MICFFHNLSSRSFQGPISFCAFVIFYCLIPQYANSGFPTQNVPQDIQNCPESAQAFRNREYKKAFESASPQTCPKLRLLSRWVQLKTSRGNKSNGLTLANYISFLRTVIRMPEQNTIYSIAETFFTVETPWSDISFILRDSKPTTIQGMAVVLAHPERSKLSKKQLLDIWQSPLLGEGNTTGQEDEVVKLLSEKGYKLSLDDYLNRFLVLHSIATDKAKKVLSQFPKAYHNKLGRHLLRWLEKHQSSDFTSGELFAFYGALPDMLRRRVEVQKWYLSKGVNLEFDIRPLLQGHQGEFQKNIGLLWRYVHVAARDALITKDYDRALAILDLFTLSDKGQQAQQVFLKGMILFRFKNRPVAALPFFKKGCELATQPQTISKFQYWAGLVCEELGQKSEAKSHFQVATHYAQTYYGQKAFDKLGLPYKPRFLTFSSDVNAYKAVDQTRNIQFAKLASALNDQGLIAPFLYLGFYELSDTVEKNALVEVCDRYFPGMTCDMSRLWGVLCYDQRTFRVHDAVPKDDFTPFVLAIIRKESGFYEAAISCAGACGLMQVMPDTAIAILGLPQTKDNRIDLQKRLRADPKFNVSIGTTYVKTQLDRFGGNKILMLAGYNAGPLNAKKWIERYGDPRTNQIDEMLWVELIPFEETREYVKRVSANERVYQHLLKG